MLSYLHSPVGPSSSAMAPTHSISRWIDSISFPNFSQYLVTISNTLIHTWLSVATWLLRCSLGCRPVSGGRVHWVLVLGHLYGLWGDAGVFNLGKSGSWFILYVYHYVVTVTIERWSPFLVDNQRTPIVKNINAQWWGTFFFYKIIFRHFWFILWDRKGKHLPKMQRVVGHMTAWSIIK